MADWSSLGVGAAGAGISMGLGFLDRTVGSLIDQAFYKKNLRSQIEAQKELMQYQNDYNSPTAQMQRLSAAGLNPNLVYGAAAPAGQSGNAASPAGHSPEGFNSYDVVRSMLHLSEMKQQESTINLNNANAEKARADARFTNQQADRYNELVDVQIKEAGQRISESASRMNVNESTIQYQTAQKHLAEAETAYRNGEIGLQEFRKQEMIAQTALYMSQKDLNRTVDYYTDVEGQMSILELEYKKLFYNDDGEVKKMAENERHALTNKFKLDAEKSAVTIGIESSKAAQWTDWVTSQLGKILGGAGTAAIGAASVQRANTPIIKKVIK